VEYRRWQPEDILLPALCFLIAACFTRQPSPATSKLQGFFPAVQAIGKEGTRDDGGDAGHPASPAPIRTGAAGALVACLGFRALHRRHVSAPNVAPGPPVGRQNQIGLDSGLSHGKQDDSGGPNDPPPQLGRQLGLVPRIQTPEITRNRAFGDIEAEFEKLTVNSRSAPGRILVHHPLDESSNLGLDLWPAEAPWARSQAPEQPKASPMPDDNSIWLNDDQGIAPCRPNTAKQNPKESILD